MNAWSRWVAWCARDEDARGQAWARTLVLAVALAELLTVATSGLLAEVYVAWEDGGIATQIAKSYVMDDWIGPRGGVVGWAVAVGAFALAGLGVAPRWTTLIGVVAWAQLGHLYSPADRAIDRILRTALIVLALGDVPVLRRGGVHPARVRAWPADLLKWILVIVYLSAGIGKLGHYDGWLGDARWPSLYRSIADPLAARLDPVAAAQWMELWRWGGRATIVLELAAPLLLTRWAPYWAIGAVGMHLGIAAFMNLGWFPWGMIALYPLVFGPWLAERRRATASATRTPPTAVA